MMTTTNYYQPISLSFWANGFYIEAVAQTCSVKKVFLEIVRNSQENTCAKSFFLKKKSLY